MSLDSGLCFAKVRPGKDRQTPIDSRGVECKNGLIQFQCEGIVPVEMSGSLDQVQTEILVNQEAVFSVGVGQCRARDFALESYSVKLVSMRMQASFDIWQTISARELHEGHSEGLIPAREVTYPVVSLMLIDTFVEFVTGDDLKKLSKDGLFGHGVPRHVKDAVNCTPKP